MKCLQFQYTSKESHAKAIAIYPKSDDDSVYSELKDFENSFYYNPKVSFSSKAEDIANEFINFINETEEEYEKLYNI